MSEPKIAEKFLRSAARHGYATAPVKTSRMPPGIPYIVGNEAAERFSYYGMTAILTKFMAGTIVDAHGQPLPLFGLLDAHGHPAPMTEAHAVETFHLFGTAVYFLPLLGALISDLFLGKYRTIFYLSIVYCCGHLALAMNSTRLGLAIGLSLIAFGAGGIKPCVSANVGDQFGAANQHLLEKVYGWFYFSINIGAGISQLSIPWLLQHYGPPVAFGVPGILMLAATVIFWLGRRKIVHIPPGRDSMVKEAFSLEGWRIVRRLLVLYVFIAVFFSLYFQSQSAWVLQADKMDRHWLGHEWLSEQLQAINSILVLVFIPLFSYVVYPLVSRVFTLTPLRKISIGLFLMAATFLITAWIEGQIHLGLRPNVKWQAAAYVLLTAAEVMVSITGLEFSYTQAPRKMKSLIMALFLGSMSMGNLITAAVTNANEGLPSTFSGEQIKDLSGVVNRLKQQSDPVSALLWQSLTSRDQEILTSYQPSAPNAKEAREVVVYVLNKMINEWSVLEVERFRGLTLRPETTELLKQNPTGPYLIHLNRLLLEDAYPLELSKLRGRAVPYLTPVQYDFFFAGLMTVAAVVFIFVALKFKTQTIIQEESPAAPA